MEHCVAAAGFDVAAPLNTLPEGYEATLAEALSAAPDVFDALAKSCNAVTDFVNDRTMQGLRNDLLRAIPTR